MLFQVTKVAIVLFVKGRLFQDTGMVVRHAAAGILFTMLVLVCLAEASVPLWAAAALAGFFGGMLQPYLFKELKYR